MINLQASLADIPGIGPRFAQKFKQLGILSVRDLLYHFPSRYEDFTQVYSISDLEPGQHATIHGIVESIEVRRTWKRHMTVVEAVIRDETGSIRAIWFNQPYVKNVLKQGRLANFSGKVAISEEDLYLSHPTYELTGAAETKHTARLVPVYPETRGLTSKGIRFVIQPLLAQLPYLEDWLPAETRRGCNLPELNAALHSVHFPARLEDAERAKRRFEFEDLFLLQLLSLEQKLKLAKEKAPAIATDLQKLKHLVGELPFELTHSQKRSLWEIVQDLARPRPMNRLLQGDVGSGKTAVAALAAVLAAENGYQTAIMAPTEVLAKQHFATFRKLFAGLKSAEQPALGLLSGSTAKILYPDDMESEIKKETLKSKVRGGEIKIIMGTHALITGGRSKSKNKPLALHKLGLVVIDEQHRFGVEQRSALAKQAGKLGKNILPHFLSMSATPIPRTLMLTVFGDLDISTIDELPAGRKKIETKIISPENRAKAYDFIRAQIRAGRQAFVICPRIEPSEAKPVNENAPAWQKQMKLWEVKSVKEEFERLSKKVFSDLKVQMLHGQMKSKEKEKIMSDFWDKKIDVLISTSVIEVGVDVPNATIMMIEGADRFGLAQLYQFRGRVGRGEHQSFCFLFTDSDSRSTADRLRAIVEAKNGFELAERDLRLRGPGEFLGQKQTGLPDFAMRGLQNVALIKDSRAAAVAVLKKSSSLAAFPGLRERLNEFRLKIHPE